jgi:UDP-3-O-acyl-N-acetylglucosamine deacetylase
LFAIAGVDYSKPPPGATIAVHSLLLMADQTLQLSGTGLFTGAGSTVRITPRPGPVTIAWEGAEGSYLGWQAFVAPSTHSTGLRIRNRVHGSTLHTVEHLASALAGAGLYEGLRIEVSGPELPLLDGAALQYTQAFKSFSIAPSRPRLRVLKPGVVAEGGSIYTFESDDETYVSVELSLDTEVDSIDREAAWHGDAEDYAERIANARTFVFERDLETYLALGLNAHVDPNQVLIVGKTLRGTGTPARDEPARHKLLDLIGDLYLHGGPPIGIVRALAPGHRATHEIMTRALLLGIIGPR